MTTNWNQVGPELVEELKEAAHVLTDIYEHGKEDFQNEAGQVASRIIETLAKVREVDDGKSD